MKTPPPTLKYVSAWIAGIAVLTLSNGRGANLSDLAHIIGFLIAVSAVGTGLAYASWYLGAHKKFPRK